MAANQSGGHKTDTESRGPLTQQSISGNFLPSSEAYNFSATIASVNPVAFLPSSEAISISAFHARTLLPGNGTPRVSIPDSTPARSRIPEPAYPGKPRQGPLVGPLNKEFAAALHQYSPCRDWDFCLPDPDLFRRYGLWEGKVTSVHWVPRPCLSHMRCADVVSLTKWCKPCYADLKEIEQVLRNSNLSAEGAEHFAFKLIQNTWRAVPRCELGACGKNRFGRYPAAEFTATRIRRSTGEKETKMVCGMCVNNYRTSNAFRDCTRKREVPNYDADLHEAHSYHLAYTLTIAGGTTNGTLIKSFRDKKVQADISTVATTTKTPLSIDSAITVKLPTKSLSGAVASKRAQLRSRPIPKNCSPAVDGLCYLSVFPENMWQEVARELGMFPPAWLVQRACRRRRLDQHIPVARSSRVTHVNTMSSNSARLRPYQMLGGDALWGSKYANHVLTKSVCPHRSTGGARWTEGVLQETPCGPYRTGGGYRYYERFGGLRCPECFPDSIHHLNPLALRNIQRPSEAFKGRMMPFIQMFEGFLAARRLHSPILVTAESDQYRSVQPHHPFFQTIIIFTDQPGISQDGNVFRVGVPFYGHNRTLALWRLLPFFGKTHGIQCYSSNRTFSDCYPGDAWLKEPWPQVAESQVVSGVYPHMAGCLKFVSGTSEGGLTRFLATMELIGPAYGADEYLLSREPGYHVIYDATQGDYVAQNLRNVLNTVSPEKNFPFSGTVTLRKGPLTFNLPSPYITRAWCQELLDKYVALASLPIVEHKPTLEINWWKSLFLLPQLSFYFGFTFYLLTQALTLSIFMLTQMGSSVLARVDYYRDWKTTMEPVEVSSLTPDLPREDYVLFIAFGTHGDQVPIKYYARLAASHGVKAAYYLAKHDTAADLRKIAKGEPWEQIPSFLTCQAAGRAGWKHVYLPFARTTGSFTNYSLTPSSQWIKPTSFGKTLAGRLMAWTAQMADPGITIGCLTDQTSGRSADGYDVLRPSYGKNDKIGVTMGSDSSLFPEIQTLLPQIPKGDHSVIMRDFKTVYCHGGAGTMQTAAMAGAQAVSLDSDLDRNYHRPLFPTDVRFNSPRPFLAHIKWHAGLWLTPLDYLALSVLLVKKLNLKTAFDVFVFCSRAFTLGTGLMLQWHFLLAYAVTIIGWWSWFTVPLWPFISFSFWILWYFPALLYHHESAFLISSIAVAFELFSRLRDDVAVLNSPWRIRFFGLENAPWLPGHLALFDTRSGQYYEGTFLDNQPGYGKWFVFKATKRSVREKFSISIPCLVDERKLNLLIESASLYSVRHNCQTQVMSVLRTYGVFHLFLAFIALFIGQAVIGVWALLNIWPLIDPLLNVEVEKKILVPPPVIVDQAPDTTTLVFQPGHQPLFELQNKLLNGTTHLTLVFKDRDNLVDVASHVRDFLSIGGQAVTIVWLLRNKIISVPALPAAVVVPDSDVPRIPRFRRSTRASRSRSPRRRTRTGKSESGSEHGP